MASGTHEMQIAQFIKEKSGKSHPTYKLQTFGPFYNNCIIHTQEVFSNPQAAVQEGLEKTFKRIRLLNYAWLFAIAAYLVMLGACVVGFFENLSFWVPLVGGAASAIQLALNLDRVDEFKAASVLMENSDKSDSLLKLIQKSEDCKAYVGKVVQIRPLYMFDFWVCQGLEFIERKEKEKTAQVVVQKSAYSEILRSVN